MTAEPPSPTRLHPIHRLWRVLPAGPRRRLLAEASAVAAPRPDAVPPPARGGIAVVGEVGRASGLGEAARLMHQGLATLAVRSWLIDAGIGVPGEVADMEIPPAATLPDGAPLLLQVNAPQLPLAAIRLTRELMRGRRIIGAWAWELPVLPTTWKIGFRFVHEIWAPTRFVADAIAGLGEAARKVPIRVVPYPVAAAPPVPARLDRAAFGLPDDAVVVLVSFNLASSFARKNPLAAIAAFREAFGDRADRLLVLKLGNPGHYMADLAGLASAIAGASNIRIETRTLPAADSHALTAACDILLSLHRSEGFGLVPAEAMLLGRPVVATAWSGNMDFMDGDSAALVGYRLVPVVDPRGTYDVARAQWAEPDVGEAATQLRRLADDRGVRRDLGARGRVMAATRLNADALAAAVAAMGLPVARPRPAGLDRALVP